MASSKGKEIPKISGSRIVQTCALRWPSENRLSLLAVDTDSENDRIAFAPHDSDTVLSKDLKEALQGRHKAEPLCLQG